MQNNVPSELCCLFVNSTQYIKTMCICRMIKLLLIIKEIISQLLYGLLAISYRKSSAISDTHLPTGHTCVWQHINPEMLNGTCIFFPVNFCPNCEIKDSCRLIYFVGQGALCAHTVSPKLP